MSSCILNKRRFNDDDDDDDGDDDDDDDDVFQPFLLVRFCSVCGLYPLRPCGRPHLALDTALWQSRVIAGALKIRSSLISSSQQAAQS